MQEDVHRERTPDKNVIEPRADLPESEVVSTGPHAKTVRRKSKRMRERLHQSTDRHLPEGTGSSSGPRWINRTLLLMIGVGMLLFGAISTINGVIRQSQNKPAFGTITANITATSCTEAARYTSTQEAQPVNDPPSDVLDASQAEQIADSLLANHLEAVNTPYMAAGPFLIEGTLPDQSRRLLWTRLWLPQLEDVADAATRELSPSEQNAVSIHLDARSGEPLVVYEGLAVESVALAGCDETIAQEAVENLHNKVKNRVIPIAVRVLVLVAGVITLAGWQHNKNRR